MDYLNRDGVPFPPTLWAAIDRAGVEAARDLLTGRRFLDVDGPYGVGLTAIEVGRDELAGQHDPEDAVAVLGRVLPVPMLRRSFPLSIRRIAAYCENQQPLDLAPVEDAAEAVAAREERLIYEGQPDFQLPGLLTAPGRHSLAGGDWSKVEQVLDDVLAAVTKLDESGFRGPYALALSPPLYNGLFRLYPGTDLPQIEHLRRLCTRGIYKAPIRGGVLVDPRVGVLVIGQDLRTGYVSQDGINHHFFVTESLVLRIDDAAAICTIAAGNDLATETAPAVPAKPR